MKPRPYRCSVLRVFRPLGNLEFCGFFQSPGCGELCSAELTWAQESRGTDQAGQQERWDMAREGNEDPQRHGEGKKPWAEASSLCRSLFYL